MDAKYKIQYLWEAKPEIINLVIIFAEFRLHIHNISSNLLTVTVLIFLSLLAHEDIHKSFWRVSNNIYIS